jgi:hypothetical protein
MPQLPGWWNWKHTYALALFLLLALTLMILAFFRPPSVPSAVIATVTWGTLTLVLSLIFMLGAAQTPTGLLVFFGAGAFGAGLGYLVGAWLTPTGDTNPLAQVQNLVGVALTGVIGTKLLALWDDLVEKPKDPPGGPPPIMTPAYFIPIVLWLVGFTVSLSAFYTVRSLSTDAVTITAIPKSAYAVLGSSRIGVLPETVVHFAGAANSPDDVSVNWDFQPVQACSNIDTPADKSKFDKELVSAFDPKTLTLTAPTRATIDDWSKICPGVQDWTLTATSNENQSKSLQYGVKFCRANIDCVPPTAAARMAAAASGLKGGAASNSTAPSASKGAGSAKDTSAPAKDTASKTGK